MESRFEIVRSIKVTPLAFLSRMKCSTRSIIIHSANRLSGSTQEGVLNIPFPRGQNFKSVRLVSFCCSNTSSSTPSTADINAARAGIVLIFERPGFTQQLATVRCDSGISGLFFVPLTGAIDHERVTFLHRRWLPLLSSPPSLQTFRLEWAATPALVDPTWALEWWAEFELSDEALA